MNREIKFRGKRIDNGEWVYGSYAVIDMKSYILLCVKSDIRIKNLKYQVIPESVGQYTGKKDKNGVEIYEGHILGYPNKKIKKIVKLGDYCFNGGEYTERGIGFYLEKYENGRKESQENGIYGYPSIDDEIISNIHETPNLLKGETK